MKSGKLSSDKCNGLGKTREGWFLNKTVQILNILLNF